MADMTWSDIEALIKEGSIVIIPTGSTEQHAILPLKTDIFIATEIARRAAEKANNKTRVVVAPPVPFGYSPEWLEWPGTISLSIETLRNLLMDIVNCLIHHGFRKIVILNGHGSNPPILWQIMTEVNRTKEARLFISNWYEMIIDVYDKVIETKGVHAEELETSVIMALGVEVDTKSAPKFNPELSFPKFQRPDFERLYAQPVYGWRTGEIRKKNPSGILGDASRASSQKGEKILAAAVDRFSEFLIEFGSKTLDQEFW